MLRIPWNPSQWHHLTFGSGNHRLYRLQRRSRDAEAGGGGFSSEDVELSRSADGAVPLGRALGCENFLYDRLKAGPASGRLRGLSSAGTATTGHREPVPALFE